MTAKGRATLCLYCGPRPAVPWRYLAQICQNKRREKKSPVSCCFSSWPLWDFWVLPPYCSKKRAWGHLCPCYSPGTERLVPPVQAGGVPYAIECRSCGRGGGVAHCPAPNGHPVADNGLGGSALHSAAERFPAVYILYALPICSRNWIG